jgi:hypothetical protein
MAHTAQTVLDFGTGNDIASVNVADAQIQAGSIVDAWLLIKASSNHSADEHLAEEIEVFAGNVVAGVGYTIYGRTRNTRLHGQFNVGGAWV